MRVASLAGVFLAGAAALAALPGCGGKAKELPKVVVPADDKADPQAVAVPAKSEPEATAVVARAVKAATDGHPERLQKAKVSRLALKGEVIRPAGPMATIRKVEAVWPDRMALADEFNDGGPVKVLMRLRRPVLWTANQRDGKTSPVEFPDLKAYEQAFAGDALGRHWMMLLVPLTDEKAVVFGTKKETIGGQTADVIKAALPGSPVFTLWFDEKTGLLGRIDFTQLEPGNATPTQKFFGLFGHRAAGGLMLPGRIEYRQNALPLETWNVDSWDFPDRLDDAGFDPPK